jgi:hypothetical protein
VQLFTAALAQYFALLNNVSSTVAESEYFHGRMGEVE